jgi:hypothetical protein
MVNRRLADAIAAADRDDPYWRVDDLMAHREQVSDAENSALVLAGAVENLPANWPWGSSPAVGQPDRTVIELTKAFGDEPYLISQLVRIALGDMAIKSTCRVLAWGEPSEATLARLQAVVLDEWRQPLLLYALRGDRAQYNELIRRIAAGKVPVSALSDQNWKPDPSSPPKAVSQWGRVYFEHQRAILLEWINEAVKIARMPAYRQPAHWKAWQATFDRQRKSAIGMYTAVLPILLVAGKDSAAPAFFRRQARLGATVILLAAERHRRKAGDWPASIEAIDRSILPEPPVDPCTGESFHWERHDGQIFIYSIGANLEDEHGADDRKLWGKGGHDDSGTSAWDARLRRSKRSPNAASERSSSSP